jgi:hypothetical protein
MPTFQNDPEYKHFICACGILEWPVYAKIPTLDLLNMKQNQPLQRNY